MKFVFIIIILSISSCNTTKKIYWGVRNAVLDGSTFYQQAAGMNWASRDSFVLKEMMAGNLPSFLSKFAAIKTNIYDSMKNRMIHAVYYVSPDYLSIGTDKDWARINITPMAAQKIADRLNCFLPTRKIVDEIYNAATVKLEPVPMYAFRDSTPTMWQHHLIIEGQRKGRRGLIAGIKKDIVISGSLTNINRLDRVAIYGWHQLNGKPIQPLYTGHINWWVDYSQGIRLVYRKIKVNGKWMDYMDVLKDLTLRRLLCDEAYCNYYRYN